MGDKTNESELEGTQDIPRDIPIASDTEEGETPVMQDDTQQPDMAALFIALQEENAQFKDRLLRAAADMENLRKRTQREVTDARAYAIADFARDMLGATDNLVRALAIVPEETRQSADPSTKSLIEGIEMTEREMQRLMQKHGVKPIQAEGEKFNPHKHQAMFEVPNDQVPEGTVVQVVQAGFEIGNRVLRPAMVGVAKGGPKAGTNKPDLHSVKIEPRVEEVDPDDDDPDFAEHIDRQV